MDPKETYARNDGAGEGQQQFNLPTDHPTEIVVRQLPFSEDMNTEAVKSTSLRAVT
jgi:hypothetical protein